MATSVFLAPAPINTTQFIPGGNTPASGALLFSYIQGTSTKQNTFTASDGLTARTNPIVLDSGGNIPGSREVWIPAGLPAKFVLAPSNDTDPPASPYWSVDNISGINDTTATQVEWIGGPSPTFVNGSTFTFSGDQTGIFTNQRRLKTVNTAGTFYSTVTSSSFSTSTTTIGINSDTTGLDSGLSVVSYDLISTKNTSLPLTVNVMNFGAKGDGVTNDATAIQNAINFLRRSQGGTLNFPSGSFLVNTAIDVTNTASITFQGAGPNVSPPVNQTDSGTTTLMLNTGGVGIDTTGSTAIQFKSIQLRVLNSYSTPSKVAILMARSATNHSAQFHNYEHLWIYMESNLGATARGRVGIYNVCAEHWTAQNCFIRTDAPLILATTDVLGVPSPYQGALFASTMTFINHRNVALITQTNSFVGLETFGTVGQIDLFNPYFSSAGAAPTSAMNFNGGGNIINIHDMEIEAMAFIMSLGGNTDALHVTGQIASYGAVTPQAHVQFSANTLTLARSFVRIRQNDGAKQTLFNNNNTETITDSILYTGTTAGINGVKLTGCTILTDDSVNSTVSSVAAGSAYLLQQNTGNMFAGSIGFYGTASTTQPNVGIAVSTSAPTSNTPFGYSSSAQALDIITKLNNVIAGLKQLGLSA